MEHRVRAALAAIVFSLLSGCGDSVESLTSDYSPPVDASGRVSFAQAQPILLEKCAICHDEYKDSSGTLRGAAKTYDAVKDYYMPASGVAPLAPQDRIVLLAWLDQNRALWKAGD